NSTINARLGVSPPALPLNCRNGDYDREPCTAAERADWPVHEGVWQVPAHRGWRGGDVTPLRGSRRGLVQLALVSSVSRFLGDAGRAELRRPRIVSLSEALDQ